MLIASIPLIVKLSRTSNLQYSKEFEIENIHDHKIILYRKQLQNVKNN